MPSITPGVVSATSSSSCSAVSFFFVFSIRASCHWLAGFSRTTFGCSTWSRSNDNCCRFHSWKMSTFWCWFSEWISKKKQWWRNLKIWEKKENHDPFASVDPTNFVFTVALRNAKQEYLFALEKVMNEIRQIVSTLNATTAAIPPTVAADGVEEMQDTERVSVAVNTLSSTAGERSESIWLHEVDVEGQRSGSRNDDTGGNEPLLCAPLSSLSMSHHDYLSMPSEKSTFTGCSPSSTTQNASLLSPTSSEGSDDKHHHRQLQDRLRKRCLEANELLTRYMMKLDELPVKERAELKMERKKHILEGSKYETEIEEYQTSMLSSLSEPKRSEKES